MNITVTYLFNLGLSAKAVLCSLKRASLIYQALGYARKTIYSSHLAANVRAFA